jgi:hypothetical protein
VSAQQVGVERAAVEILHSGQGRGQRPGVSLCWEGWRSRKVDAGLWERSRSGGERIEKEELKMNSTASLLHVAS